MLALWSYQWDTYAWNPAWSTLLLALWSDRTEPAAPVLADVGNRSNAGGGGRKRRNTAPLPEDFWDVRERYLRRFAKPIAKQAGIATSNSTVSVEQDTIPLAARPQSPNPLILQQQVLSAALTRAETAMNAAELRQAVARAQSILLDISKIQQQHIDKAIAILLLDVF